MSLLLSLIVVIVLVLISPAQTRATNASDPVGPHVANLVASSESLLQRLETYDIRLRPDFGGKPLEVGMQVYVVSFDDISEVSMDYTITLYLTQTWRDRRLAFSDNVNERLTLMASFSESIWVPDSFFANDKNSYVHDITEGNAVLRVSGDGTIVYVMRATLTLSCNMDLHHYPHDEQNCTIEIESYGYTVLDVVMNWLNGSSSMASPSLSVSGIENFVIPQFTLVDYRSVDKIEELATGIYQRLSISFRLDRNIGYFIFQTYLPCILIVELSWVSFWINHEAIGARITLGITTVLTMTTISNGVRASLPPISYVKAIDIYLVMCFVFVFAALIEYAFVNSTLFSIRRRELAAEQEAAEQTAAGEAGGAESLGGGGGASELKAASQGSGGSASACSLRARSPASAQGDSDSSSLSGSAASHRPRLRLHARADAAHDPMLHQLDNHRLSSPSRLHARRRRRRRTTNTVGRSIALLRNARRQLRRLNERLPKIHDVSTIDLYSRVAFPFLFLLFNVGYWSYYLAPKELTDTHNR